ncbi:uncharacterized protein A1O9_09071 [Exophiala aquamarina CBS 119918]|uniref:3-carboxymuconate cyclase n=1 Tax=Exophiala aquamarina CBS 119918 TaxID=1182545 RepID=A0A072P3C4_9EURO|nr:uncharacterized protein A1O9_09071 [Exophiala aquamarina CBS 119918]KEF54629.1 hypothetical protein A1O9_09071 [Exophiala aquamarina CBS 119918]
MFLAPFQILLLAAYLMPGASSHPYGPETNNAIFFLTNDQTNAVVAIPIGADGKLSGGTVTGTGGAGSNSINGNTNEPASPDPLIGQSAIVVAGQNVFAVNAGSNTLSMLSIDMQDPTKLTMVGQPMPVQGEFPNTVAVSMKNRLVCVGTTGAKNGVSCATFSKQGLDPFDDLRSFGLVQSTPPVGPTNSVSQLFFSEDQTMLFATVKGDPAVNATGFFSAFPVQNAAGWPGKGGASLATMDTRSSPAGTAVLFGSANIPGTSSVFVTDASFGGAILSVNPANGQATLVAKQTIDGQAATCWVTISRMTGSAFVTDVLRSRIVEMDVTNASILSITDLSATGSPGFLDLISAGFAIYVLAPGNATTPSAVTVLDVSGGQGNAKLLQQFDVSSLGVGSNAQGMAMLRK